ncbi:MAG: hypothetical protein M0R74_19480 [Dehalococcoidia bacterium]|nr:hypothetical protein [Dehalococcoidia bacterium]
MKKKFTVVLLRPDYIADEFGKDIFSDYVMAYGPDGAIAQARKHVVESDGVSEEWAEDYHALVVYEGYQQSLI